MPRFESASPTANPLNTFSDGDSKGEAENLKLAGLNEARILGRNEERRRTEEQFNAILSSKIMRASFAVDEICERLTAPRGEENGALIKAATILRGSIYAIIKGCDEVFDPDVRESSIVLDTDPTCSVQ